MFRKHLGNPFAAVFILTVIRLVSATYRYRTKGLDRVMAKLEKGDKILLCHWHQQFFPAIARYGRWFNRYKPALMISRSEDGRIIANVANRVGWHTTRGSSTRGGGEAMVEMIDHVRAHGLGGHILDGPTGPVGVVKPGAIRIAQKSGALLVPVILTAEKRWQAGSWDRFVIPRPFSTVVLTFEDPMEPPEREADPEAFEKVRKSLEERMLPCLY
ncbi:lysophospholipid acyltransferase family protein [Desulfobotulus sp. H1]|uniref:Lysophospholipid acyltransferase family protein n=1 Tax=Desulfobotulus pelophilus TaxID=2823377 RepID=A0ABT3N9W8_9BACT|nr:lysophospholipid acyltransferase family protein [Desulfobotulus pelophilus]